MTKHYYPFHKYWMHHKDKQKKNTKMFYLWFQWTWLKKMYFRLTMTGARKNETLILLPTLGHHHLLFWLCLPKFCTHFFLWELKRSWCCWYNFWVESFEVQALQVCSLLVVAIGDPPNHRDLDLGGSCFVFLMLILAAALLVMVFMLIVVFLLISFFITIVGNLPHRRDLDLSGPHFAFLMLTIAHNSSSCDLYVNRRLLSLLFSL